MVLENDYRGDQVDLFALGVILFEMAVGYPPFVIADAQKDPYYKLIQMNLPNVFWMVHS